MAKALGLLLLKDTHVQFEKVLMLNTHNNVSDFSVSHSAQSTLMVTLSGKHTKWWTLWQQAGNSDVYISE